MQWPLSGGGRSPEAMSITSSDNSMESSQVVGTTNLFENGQIRLIPMPSPDPKDPLNLPNWRKWTAIAVICFFGALALSAEIVVSALLPIFILEYAGVDPRTINDLDLSSSGGAAAVSPLAVLPPGVPPPDIEHVAMLATIPLISNGIASYFMVPLSIAIGRRPVILFAGICAWAGGLWAGMSTSLNSHLAARAVQALGAGAVEALIPLIIQDMVFIHQRNRAMSAIVSSQGIFIVGMGAASPYIASNFTWRWIYYITSGFGVLAWLLLIGFLPETRWTRSKQALAGQKIYPMPLGANRPDIDSTLGTRSWRTYLGFGQNGYEWRNAGRSMLETLRSTYFPAVVWAVLANSSFLIANQAAVQLGSFALLAQGWQFQYVGLSVVPFVAATVLVYIFGGPVADMVANSVARMNRGSREPEHHLLNLIFPFTCGVAGCFIFGYAGQVNLHWAVLLTGSFLIIFGFLTVMTVLNVFVVESYPMWAGPVLVNVSSLRIIISFFLASRATTWVAEKGMLNTFAIYAEAMVVLSLGIPLFYFLGKKMRQFTAGSIEKGKEKKLSEKEKKIQEYGSSNGDSVTF